MLRTTLHLSLSLSLGCPGFGPTLLPEYSGKRRKKGLLFQSQVLDYLVILMTFFYKFTILLFGLFFILFLGFRFLYFHFFLTSNRSWFFPLKQFRCLSLFKPSKFLKMCCPWLTLLCLSLMFSIHLVLKLIYICLLLLSFQRCLV